MDKEKLLKKYILMFSRQTVCICAFWFLFLIKDIVSLDLLIIAPVPIIAAFISKWIDDNSRGVMPMIISIHDTVEKMNRQIAVLAAVIVVVLIISGIVIIYINSVAGRFISSFICLFVNLIRLTQRKIEYIKNKPEGLNF